MSSEAASRLSGITKAAKQTSLGDVPLEVRVLMETMGVDVPSVVQPKGRLLSEEDDLGDVLKPRRREFIG